MANPGMRIYKDCVRPDRKTIELFTTVPAANVADATSRLFAMDARISPMGKCKHLLGPALTVKSSMADNFIFHKALSLAKEGDIIVVDSCGDTHYSVCGDIMFRYAISRGVAGFVVDGCVRDLDFLQEHDFPVFAVGATPRGPYKNPVGEINSDISCGGQAVHPGDIVLGDADGVVVIRKDDALDVHEKVLSILEKERLMTDLIEQGRWEEESPILTMVNREIERLDFEILE